MAHLIRINYPLSSFNYRLSCTKVANFSKIHHMVSEQQLLKQVAQLSQRDRAAGGLVMAKSGRLELGDNIYGL